jgi:hypothetical protein
VAFALSSIGYVCDLSHGNGLDIGLGTQFTINDRPDRLDRYYGDGLGYAFEFFLRIRPSLHSHGVDEHSNRAVTRMEK